MAEPLTREEREDNRLFVERTRVRLRPARSTKYEADLIDRYEATVQAADERIDELRAAMCLAMADLAQHKDIRAAILRLSDAISADDAARGSS